MARKAKPAFDSVFQAVAEGTAADLRHMLADGAAPDDREEMFDETPLMAAAALGRLEAAQVLVEAGADVNHHADGQQLEHEFPFLQPLENKAPWCSPLGYAALYGRQEVYDFLAPRASPEMKAAGVALRQAREDYLRSLDPKAREKFLKSLEPKAPSNKQTDRKTFLAENPGLKKWLQQCALCRKEGLRPNMPQEIDKKGTAAQARRLWPTLALKDYMCEQCGQKVARAKKAAEEKMKQALANLPPHVKVKEHKPRGKS